jgi:hypothetical protein
MHTEKTSSGAPGCPALQNSTFKWDAYDKVNALLANNDTGLKNCTTTSMIFNNKDYFPTL